MSILEIIALISTIVCVILLGRENILAWPIGIISAISLILVYIPNAMYANIVLQGIFVIQCAMGWYNWGSKNDISISKYTTSRVFFHIIGALLIGWMYAKVNLELNSNLKWYNTYFDGISTTIALLGNWYLTKKVIQAWPLFMIYNIIIAILLASQGIYLLSGLNILLLFISFNAYYSWKRNLNMV